MNLNFLGLNGAIPAFDPAPAGIPPARTLADIKSDVSFRVGTVRKTAQWYSAALDAGRLLYNADLAAPVAVGMGAVGGVAAAGTSEEQRQLIKDIVKKLPENFATKSLDSCRTDFDANLAKVNDLKARARRFREVDVARERLPQSVRDLVRAEKAWVFDAAAGDQPGDTARTSHQPALVALRARVEQDFKPQCVADIEAEIAQCEDQLKKILGASYASTFVGGKAGPTASNPIFQEHKANVKRLANDIVARQTMLRELRDTLTPLALVDARKLIADEKRENSFRTKVRAVSGDYAGPMIKYSLYLVGTLNIWSAVSPVLTVETLQPLCPAADTLTGKACSGAVTLLAGAGQTSAWLWSGATFGATVLGVAALGMGAIAAYSWMSGEDDDL